MILFLSNLVESRRLFTPTPGQGFIQDQIIASHTCFGGHMDVNCLASLQTINVSDDLRWTTNIRDTISFTLIFEA